MIRDRFIKARYHQDDTYSHVTLTPAGIKYIEEPLIEEIDLYGLLNGYEIDQIKKMIMMSSRHHEVIPQIEKLLIKKKPTRREFKSFNLIKEKVNTINTKLKKKVISIDLANNQKFSILKAILNMLN